MTINYKKFIRCYFSPTEGGNDKKFNINFSESGVPDFRPGVKAFCVVEHFHMGAFNSRFDQPIYICSDLPQPNLIKNTPTTIGGTPGPRAENYGPDNILINLDNINTIISGVGSFRTYQYDMNIIENGLFCILPSDITFTFRWARLGTSPPNSYNFNMAKVADDLITGRFKLILRFYLIEDTIYRVISRNLTDMGLEYDKFIRVFLSPNTNGNNKTFYIDYSSFSPEFQPGRKVWCAVEHFCMGNGANAFFQPIYIYSDMPQYNLYLDGSDNSPEHIILNIKAGNRTIYGSYNYNMECIENGFVTILQPSIFINCRYSVALNEIPIGGGMVSYFKLILRFYLLDDDE